MTIVLGMVGGTNGTMLLAADSEITDTVQKGQAFKIPFWFEGVGTPTGGMAIAVAGEEAYAKSAATELHDGFQANPQASLDGIEAIFRERLKKFYKEYVVPFSCYPANERPELWLIVAAQRNGESRMWETARSTIREVRDFAGKGIGEMQARSMLDSLYLADASLEINQLIAAYTIFAVKRTAASVGQETDLIIFRGMGPVPGFSREAVRAFEEVFRKFSTVEARLLHSIFGSTYYTEENVTRKISEMRQAFEKAVFKHGLGDFIREVQSNPRWTISDQSPSPPSQE